jgi:UDP-glucose 4-epimerase
MKILVVGGAGYIGSHMVKALMRQGADVQVFDDLSSGHADAVPAGRLVVGSLADAPALDKLFTAGSFDAVMHFASSIQVGESVRDPAPYYRNNVLNTQNLLDAMLTHSVKRFVFSSTAAVFGEPEYVPIDERHRLAPLNPYGWSKLMVEQMLQDYQRAYGFESVCLRYFNAAGADPEGDLGERHEPETHLIPLVLQVASGRRPHVTVFGNDYDTPDGTCIRDYIHVDDLCSAHMLALQRLLAGEGGGRFNLGNGEGFSVDEVIATARGVTGHAIPVVYEARRPGDPARLVANAQLAREVLGWRPQRADLANIVADAWAWEQKLGALQR